MFYTNKEKSVVKKNTSPTSTDIKVAKEKGIKNYLHSSFIPLDQVNFKKKLSIYQGSLFDDECEGICGV